MVCWESPQWRQLDIQLIQHCLWYKVSMPPFSLGNDTFSPGFQLTLFTLPIRLSVLGQTYGTFLYYEPSYPINFFNSEFWEPMLCPVWPAGTSVRFFTGKFSPGNFPWEFFLGIFSHGIFTGNLTICHGKLFMGSWQRDIDSLFCCSRCHESDAHSYACPRRCPDKVLDILRRPESCWFRKSFWVAWQADKELTWVEDWLGLLYERVTGAAWGGLTTRLAWVTALLLTWLTWLTRNKLGNPLSTSSRPKS